MSIIADEDECRICFDRIEHRTLTPCGHIFCFKCIYIVAKGHFDSLCPGCRCINLKGWDPRSGLICDVVPPPSSPPCPKRDADFGLVGDMPTLDEGNLELYVGSDPIPTPERSPELPSDGGSEPSVEPESRDDPDWEPDPDELSDHEISVMEDPEHLQQPEAHGPPAALIVSSSGLTFGMKYTVRVNGQEQELSQRRVQELYPQVLASYREHQRRVRGAERARRHRERVRLARQDQRIPVRRGRPSRLVNSAQRDHSDSPLSSS